jgi:hypothetical protein
VSPCTDLEHVVTSTGTLWVQEHLHTRTIRYRGTFATSDGHTGKWVRPWTGRDIFGPGEVSSRTMNELVLNYVR